MSRFWSPIVHQLAPYVPGEQPKIADLVKLNTNESPYGPSPRALAAIAAETTDSLRLYPESTGLRLREVIAAAHGLSAGEVFVGNGSDEVLAHAFLGLLKQERPLLYPDISYSFYPVYCRLYDIAASEIPLDADFRIRVADYDRPSGAVILPNPNAPTGIGLPLREIEALLRQNADRLVVVDEAYVDFGAESAARLIPAFDNLLVVQTFSKSRALAGLRVGFALGQRELIEGLERVKDSFNSYPLDRLALAGATAAYEDHAFFEETRGRIIASRTKLSAALAALGFTVLPSAANFVFARHAQRSGADLAAALRRESILVRHFARPRIGDFLRITIGTEAQCARLVEALETILAGSL